ncbi:MAG: Rpn family recombination-promoting nuclease/putative transposase [Acidobacteria bacterium]|nr:Rpn family recombination-promoting nuclease/putative transposase [Acidobacteriota bacterium]
MRKRQFVSFDWAMKRLLRSKANFEVLEGFLSELLMQDITILEVLESETDRERGSGKAGRVDLKVSTGQGEIVIIEIQYTTQYDYFHRMLFGVSRAVTEHMDKGSAYSEVKKVISVDILYFELGHGKDYVYRGKTEFVGIHEGDVLELSPKQKELYGKDAVHQIYPEYYLLKINRFDDVARDSLDEWIYFLKNEEIRGEFKARGLAKAKEVLDILKMTPEEREEYERYMDEVSYQASLAKSNFDAGRLDGRKEGRAEGLAEGRAKGRVEGMAEGLAEVALRLIRDGFDDDRVSELTGLDGEQLAKLRSQRLS